MLGVGELVSAIFCLFYILYRLYSVFAAIIVVSILGALICCYLYNEKTYWRRQGVPGPAANLFTGNALEYGNGLHTLDEKWIAQYGKTYGSYLFSSPELASIDLDVLRKVLIKNFDHFTDRMNLLNVDPSDQTSLLATSLVSLKGDHWGSVRSQVAPAFSSAKIKLMIPLFNECLKICNEVLDLYAKEEKPVPIRDVITRLTLDMTSKCAFGVDFGVQHNSNSEFIYYARKFTEFDLRSPEVIFLTFFPNICTILQSLTGISVLNNSANKFFLNTLEDLLEKRKNGKISGRKDFFQILISSLVEDGKDRTVDKEIEFDLRSSNKGLTKGDILGQAFMFVLAGFETTPIALHLTLYMLAVHEEIQERCRREVEEVCGCQDDVTYEMLSELKYTEQCIMETLRMYPPVVRTNRKCTKDISINGIEMKKEFIFSVPIRAIHYCEDYYENPRSYDPDRWSPISRICRDPLTFLPFGHGPRNCIGMRVAQIQMKMTIAHILRKYKLEAAEKLDLPLKIDTTGSMRTVETLSILLYKL